MACYHPITGYQGEDGVVRFNAQCIGTRMTIACGRCRGCRLEHSRQWAVRCMHESQMHERNAFVTLTYNDENLPADGSLVKEHWQKFIKRARKHFAQCRCDRLVELTSGRKIRHSLKEECPTRQRFRYFHCGEYGEKFGRPHYHGLLFGIDFAEDRYSWTTRDGYPIYRSPQLEELWKLGNSEIGSVTWQSASYVARYIMTKKTGDMAEEAYLDKETGSMRQPEYTTMSRKPGIGKAWIDAYMDDVYPNDFVVVQGAKARPPRYYDDQVDDHSIEKVKEKRVVEGKKHDKDRTPERLKSREKAHRSRDRLRGQRDMKA